MEKKKVLPGEAISTEEEFEPGKNAFLEDGNVYSTVSGEPEEDAKHKQISVNPRKELKTLQRDSIVFGRVDFVKDNSLTLTILQDPDKELRQVIPMSRAMLPVRNVSQDYVERLKDEFKIGDFVKARISKISQLGVDLTTSQRDLGVVKAFCSKCREPLHLFGETLKCMACGRTEKRKISSDYFLK